MKTITFYNVTIAVECSDAKTAYQALCEALTDLDAEWSTDTYSEAGACEEETEPKSTSELYP